MTGRSGALVAEEQSAGGIRASRHRNLDAHTIAHGTHRDTPGWARTGRDEASASAQLDGLVEARTALDSTPRG
jgi:hypothetical protein